MARERRGRRPLLTLAFLLVISFRVKADDLEVKRLQRIDTNSINIFCTTTNGVTPDDAKDQYELSFESPPSGPISLVSSSQASSNPQVFEVNVEDLYGSQTVFTLALKTREDQAVKASSDVAFTLADVSGVKASWVGARKLSEPGEVLRLYGHPVRVLACPEGGEDNKDCLDFPKEESYQASSGLSGAAAVLCVPTEGDPAVPFCLVTVDITTAAGITYGGEVRLSHQEDQTAPAEGTLSVAKDIGAGEKRDLLYWSDGRLLACLGSTSCMIQDFPSSNNQYDVFFVDYQEADGEITGASLVMKFEDYSPIGTVIEPSTLEMRWTQTRNQYKLLLTDIEGQEVTITEPPFTSAIVNCEDMKECFGYFINLPPGDFKVMVRPWTGSNMLEENSVLSSKQTIQISKSKSSDLKIQEVHLDWSSDGSKAFPKVCFTNKAVTSKNLSHFELVIVDQKGHWIRSRGATQKTEGVTCFTGVTLPSDELLIPGKVSVIVIERDLDGLNVVASAHAEAFFKRSLDLVITKFEITDIKSQKFSIHYTGPSGTLSGGELSAMNIDAARIINMELTGVSETRADFEASDLLMAWIKQQTKLTWVLRLHVDDGNFVYGEEQFTFPDVVTFPTCDPAHLIGKKQVVRISCDSHSLETDTIQMTDDDLAIQASTGVVGVSYHLLDKPATLPASIQLCRKPVDNGNVDICTRQVELKDATAGVKAMTEIKVEYEAKITVQHTPSDGNSLDGLVYYYQEDPNPPTLKYCPRADCEVQGYIGVQDLEVLVVYKDDTTGKSVESEQRTVYGLELRGAQITSSVSELAIKKMPERDVYQVIIENSTSPGMEVRSPTFTTVKVMCQDVEIVCYAYLPLTAGGKYKATVSPYEDKAGEGAPDKMNQIVSLEMTPLQYKEKRDTEVPKNLVLKQINRVKSDTATFGTDVTVFNDLEPVDGIASVTLVVAHENGDGTGDEHLLISTEVEDGIIEQGVEKVFHFDINPVDNILSPPTTVLFIAKNKDNDALAVAEVTVEFKTLDPAMDWVGGADTAPLRVKTDLAVEINGVPFAAGTSYSLDFESDPKPVEVCVTLDNTDPAGGTVRQCDLTRSIGSYKDMDVDEVELNIDDAKRVMTVKSTFSGMEAVLYDEEDNGIVGVTFSCAIENTCSSEISDAQMVELSRVFKVLVVGKDGADLVTGAKVVDFEDFQTYVQRFSDGSDLEVRWEASNNNGFTVQLDNDVPDGFTDVAVQCGGAEQRACKAYFTNLKADASYKAKVIKENTVVSFTTPATAGSAVPLSITQLSEVSTNPLQMELKFSVDADVTGVEYIEYVVIDPPVDGEAEQRIVFKDTTDIIAAGDNDITFDDAELPDAGAGSTVLAVVHGPGGVLAAGKVVAAFKAINPTMSWVGVANTAPLRVKTDLDVEINGVLFAAGTSYSLDFVSAPNPVEVCATLENTAPAGGTVRQCDMTRSIQDFQELNVDNIELNYDAGKHVMTVSSTFAGMEAVLYHGGDTGVVSETFSCDTPGSCSSDISGQIPGLSSTFKVLVVGVDAGAVTGAKVVDFVDFQVRVQRFSAAGDLEVRWRADSPESYEIHLDADVPDGFTDVSVACGGAEAADNRACKAYFTKLEADKPYKAELQRGITVVSATVPAIPGTYTPVTITRIAEVSRTPLQTQLTFSSGAEVTGVEYIECVVIDPPADGEATQRIVFKDTNEGIAEGDNDITFDVGELPISGAESTVLVVVHGPDGVDSEALAAGKVTVVFEALNPTMNWVGEANTAPLRVNTDLDVEINGVPFAAGTSYSLNFESVTPPVEVCATLENTAPAGGTVRQCDMTRSIQDFQDMAVGTIELNFDEGKHVMTVSSTFAGMEAVLYLDGDVGLKPVTFSCDTANTCSSPDISGQISGLNPAFKVLVVGVDTGAVTGANVVDFVDFQVRVQRFSGTGDLEVRWRADSADTYEIHLDADVPDGFTDVSVACGGADNRACKAYFTKLEADKPYKAELQRGITVVSATVPAAPGTDTPVTITRIAEVSRTPLQTQLTFSSGAEVTGVEYIECVVIDPPADGKAEQRIVFKDTNEGIAEGDNDITFDVGELPISGAESTVLVVVHGADGVDSDALAAGKVVVTFQVIEPTMTWVGGPDTAPLRIETSMKLDVNGNACDAGTSYILDFEANPSPPELCVALVDAVEGGTVLQCDGTQAIQNAGDLSINTVELNYDAGKHVMTVSSTFAGMEAVLYHGGDTGVVPETFSCDTTDTCSSPDISGQISGLSPAFKVLVVGVDAGAVTGAKVVDFEDFQVRVQRFSGTGDLEVRWRADSVETYEIHLDADVPDGFTDVSVACGGADNRACKAYFTKLEAEKPYKAELQRGITVVSATVPAGQESGIPVTITKIAQVSKDPLQTQLTVTADTEVIGIEYLEFVVIEPLSDNEATQHLTFKSVNCIINVDTTAVFDVEELPSTGVELTLLFVVHGRDGVDSEALAAGKVVVTLADIKPTINWVGGQDTAPLRIHANQELLINNIQFPEGTFYLLDFDASSNIEICVTLDNTAATGTTLNQCDLTQTPQNVADMEVQKVELSHEAEGKSTITVSSTFTSMEAVMYNAGESGKVSESFSCVTENTCSSDVTTILAELKTTFKFLAVGVADPDAVSGAKLIDVEDFQTSALRFSDSGVVEVRWRASSDQLFNVHVDNEVSEGFTDVSVQCGGSEQRACKAYYTMLKPNMAYKAEVQKDIVAVSTAVPATTASVTTLNIARISKMSESPIQTQLTVSAATEVTGIQYVDFVMIDPPKDNIAPQHIAFSEAPDSIDANSCIITFDDTDQPKMLVGVTVLVVAHGAEGSDSDILASGEVLVYFADLVPPKMTKVGSEEMESLKVENGDLDVRVNGNVCRAKSVCYFLESDTYLEPPEVCRDTGSGVEQCDMTGSYVVKKLLAVTGLDLMDKGLPEKELRVTADFDANSVTMETMIYDDAGIETSTPLTCNIESASCVFPVAPQNTIFKILLMALDNKAGVVESNTIEFEDFQTRMEQLTNTDLEVSWKSSQASNFTITMNPPPEGFPSVLTVECGGEQPEDSAKCLAFFLLLPEGAGCTANVKRKGDDAKTVSAFLQLDIAEGFSAPITITRLIARERAGKKPSLSVCFKDELFANGKGGEVMTRAGSPKYSLVVVDAFGRQLLSPSDLSSLSSSSSVEDDLCFGDLSLGFDFDLRQKLRVIVKREGMEGERVRAVGDIEAHLLDPRGLIDVRQVGPRTVRVGWKDVHQALGYEVLIGALRLAGGCDGEQDPQCVRYLHVDRGESPLVVTLKAVDARVSHEVEVPLPLQDMSTLRIYSTALTDENRLQVCFNPAPKASHYLLSLEDEKGLVLESRRVFPQQEDDFTCVLSAEEVDLGGYLSLRTLVTAFDASDMPVTSGTATIQEFFLSPKRKVLIAVNETNHDLITTWHLLHDPEKITSYYVTLERATDGRKNDPVVLSSTVTSHVFEGVAPGRYSVCVAASVEDAGSILRSREVCSDIFSVPGVDVEIPEVAEVKVKTTGLDKALVTWQKPGDEDDVTNYVITWTKAAPSSNSAVSSTSNQARPRHPLPIVAQGFRDVEPDFRDQGRHHRIVPASSPSVEVLTLDPKKAYEVCVSAVRKGVAGNHVCKGVQLGKDDPVDSPTDLVFENDLLKWNGVVSASGYLVEWRPRRGGISSGGQEEVKTTSWTSGNLSPGRWVVSVRATTETSASKPVSADYLKEGIEIVSAVQPNNNQLLIRWQEEPRPPCAESKCHYAITTSYNQAPLWHSCSGLKGDCERAIEVQGGTQVEVALERDGVKSSRKEMVFAFSAMSDLNQRSSSGGRDVTVSWRQTGDARLYNVTLFSDSSRSSVKLTEMLKRESFTLHDDEVEGSVLLIQPCADKTHCGSGQNITVTSATDTPSRNIPGLVASVVGGVLFLVVVALVVTVVILKRVKRKEVDDTCRLEEVTREHPMSSQRSIGLHSSVQVISMSALSHEENKHQ